MPGRTARGGCSRRSASRRRRRRGRRRSAGSTSDTRSDRTRDRRPGRCDIAGRLLKTRLEGCAFSPVDLVMRQVVDPAPRLEFFKYFPRAVVRAVVDNYDFLRRVRRIAYSTDDGLNRRRFVEQGMTTLSFTRRHCCPNVAAVLSRSTRRSSRVPSSSRVHEQHQALYHVVDVADRPQSLNVHAIERDQVRAEAPSPPAVASPSLATSPPPTPKNYWLFVIALTIVLLIVYQPVWNGGFLGRRRLRLASGAPSVAGLWGIWSVPAPPSSTTRSRSRLLGAPPTVGRDAARLPPRQHLPARGRRVVAG